MSIPQPPRILVMRLEEHYGTSVVDAAHGCIKSCFDASGYSTDRRNIELHFRLSPSGFVAMLDATVPAPLHPRCHRDGYSIQEFHGHGWRVAVKLINAKMHDVLNQEEVLREATN